MISGLASLIVGTLWGIAGNLSTLKTHGQALEELKTTAATSVDKEDSKFDQMNTKLDKISDNTNYLRGKVDEMDRRQGAQTNAGSLKQENP
jgi:hypothetical protein